MPVTWQGWLVTAAFVLLVVGDFLRIDRASHSVSDTLISFAPQFIALLALLIGICFLKGETPKWQWGSSKLITFVWFLVVSHAAGGIGALFTTAAVSGWYRTLVKPTFNPPASVFGPVWSLLYTLMAVSAYMVWRARSPASDKSRALRVFGLQLVLNALWSPIFFGLHRPDLAFGVLMALWFSIIWMIVAFAKCSKAAAWLLVPYVAWVTFALVLNFFLWTLNPL
ncbi:tryptophan-rich sensory protein [Candidatus Uhrbacteria bacterium]|nr:tryptophan-rich sensory protein [Candidatus Uhrbacteria bacterium]